MSNKLLPYHIIAPSQFYMNQVFLRSDLYTIVDLNGRKMFPLSYKTHGSRVVSLACRLWNHVL